MPTAYQTRMLNKIRREIRGCFGTADGVFGGHENDSERARKILIIVLKYKIGSMDFENIVRRYLRGERFSANHIKRQIKRMNQLSSYLPDHT